MKDYTEPFAANEHSQASGATSDAGGGFPSVFLPKMVYEAMPAAYISMGTLFVLGATYIGLDYTPMVSYLAVGLSCILAGATVSIIRRKERSD